MTKIINSSPETCMHMGLVVSVQLCAHVHCAIIGRLRATNYIRCPGRTMAANFYILGASKGRI